MYKNRGFSKIVFKLNNGAESGCHHERARARGEKGGGGVGGGFSRAAAAPSAEGDRCPRRVQCRGGRSRGKVCCCARRV